MPRNLKKSLGKPRASLAEAMRDAGIDRDAMVRAVMNAGIATPELAEHDTADNWALRYSIHNVSGVSELFDLIGLTMDGVFEFHLEPLEEGENYDTAEVVKGLIRSRGLNQADLVKSIGWSLNYVCRCLSSTLKKQHVPLAVVVKLFSELGFALRISLRNQSSESLEAEQKAWGGAQFDDALSETIEALTKLRNVVSGSKHE